MSSLLSSQSRHAPVDVCQPRVASLDISERRSLFCPCGTVPVDMYHGEKIALLIVIIIDPLITHFLFGLGHLRVVF